ncbi:hypothetical protein ACSZMD_12500 [Aeromonas veronii]
MNNIHIEPALLVLRDFSQEVRHHLHTIPEASASSSRPQPTAAS